MWNWSRCWIRCLRTEVNGKSCTRKGCWSQLPPPVTNPGVSCCCKRTASWRASFGPASSSYSFFKLRQTESLEDELGSMPGVSPWRVATRERHDGKDRGGGGAGSTPQDPGLSMMNRHETGAGQGNSCGSRRPWPFWPKGTWTSAGVTRAASFCIWLFSLLQGNNACPCILFPVPFSARLS